MVPRNCFEKALVLCFNLFFFGQNFGQNLGYHCIYLI